MIVYMIFKYITHVGKSLCMHVYANFHKNPLFILLLSDIFSAFNIKCLCLESRVFPWSSYVSIRVSFNHHTFFSKFLHPQTLFILSVLAHDHFC